jgi:hypothetical protein
MKLIRLLLGFAASAGLCLAAPASWSQQAPSVPLGIVGAAAAARIGNSTATEGATVYSGDSLSTDDQGSLLVRIGPLFVQLESSSSAHIYRAPYGAVLELKSGSVVYSTPGGGQNVVIVASDVRATPNVDLPDVGRVSVDDPCNVSVQSQKGKVDVRTGHESREIEEGKTYKVHAENSITYRKYLSPDDDDYHRYHEHAPCVAAYQAVKGKPPIAPGHSAFIYVAGAGAAAITTIGVVKALESPNRP